MAQHRRARQNNNIVIPPCIALEPPTQSETDIGAQSLPKVIEKPLGEN